LTLSIAWTIVKGTLLVSR